MVNSMYNEGRNILLIVEGADDEVNLFKQVIKHFPEIKLPPENILVYNTNLWVLNDDLSREFGSEWYESKDIEFREFLKSKFPAIKGKKVTDIFLVFDYERQDNRFNARILENMCKFFNNSVENGQLYINYPMIESYRHLNVTPLPDDTYKDRICNITDIANYKQTVGKETKFHDYRKYDRFLLQNVMVHNIKKISYILDSVYDIDNDLLINLARQIDHIRIAKKQNLHSKDDEGFVYVLCTCILFVIDYNVKLLFDENAIY